MCTSLICLYAVCPLLSVYVSEVQCARVRMLQSTKITKFNDSRLTSSRSKSCQVHNGSEKASQKPAARVIPATDLPKTQMGAVKPKPSRTKLSKAHISPPKFSTPTRMLHDRCAMVLLQRTNVLPGDNAGDKTYASRGPVALYHKDDKTYVSELSLPYRGALRQHCSTLCGASSRIDCL